MTTYIILQNEDDDNKIALIDQNEESRIQHLENDGWFDTDISFVTTQDEYILYLTIEQGRTITGAYLCKDEAGEASAQSFSDSLDDWRNEPSIVEEYEIELDSDNDENDPIHLNHIYE